MGSFLYIAGYVLFINLLAFALMALDKYRAKRELFRIPEFTLFFTALMGGSIGAIAGIYICRHKTRRPHFVAGMPLILVIQITIIVILARSSIVFNFF